MSGGILLVDKPGGITSHDVVARARRALGTRKVGHAGTLDPMATGLLVLGVDSSTRLLTYLVGLGKQYTATIHLGCSSTTDDAEGELSAARDTSLLGSAEIEAAVATLTGRISQVPSTFSAIKVDGKRSYELARAGHEVELKAREVTVSGFEVLSETRRRLDQGADLEAIDLDVRVDCSSGTYIRALARDLGAALGVGGYLTALRRTSIGPFDVQDAVLATAIDPAALRAPSSIAAQLFPSVELDAQQLVHLTQGKKITVDAADAAIMAAVTASDRLVGLVSVNQGVARVLVNFPTEEVLA